MRTFKKRNMVLFILLFPLVTSCNAPSNRIPIELNRPDGQKVTCMQPPPDIIAKSASAKVDLAVKHLGEIVKGSIDSRTELERIRREISPSVADFEVIDFRLCQQYANGVLNPGEYQKMVADLLPKLL